MFFDIRNSHQSNVINFIETPCSPAVSSIRLGQSHEIRCLNILYRSVTIVNKDVILDVIQH